MTSKYAAMQWIIEAQSNVLSKKHQILPDASSFVEKRKVDVAAICQHLYHPVRQAESPSSSWRRIGGSGFAFCSILLSGKELVMTVHCFVGIQQNIFASLIQKALNWSIVIYRNYAVFTLIR